MFSSWGKVRKRCLPMAIRVHEANIHDSKGAMPTLEKLTYKFPRLSKILADGCYQTQRNSVSYLKGGL